MKKYFICFGFFFFFWRGTSVKGQKGEVELISHSFQWFSNLRITWKVCLKWRFPNQLPNFDSVNLRWKPELYIFLITPCPNDSNVVLRPQHGETGPSCTIRKESLNMDSSRNPGAPVSPWQPHTTPTPFPHGSISERGVLKSQP